MRKELLEELKIREQELFKEIQAIRTLINNALEYCLEGSQVALPKQELIKEVKFPPIISSKQDKRRNKSMPFKKARAFAYILGLKNLKNWIAYFNGEFPELPKRPQDLPKAPYQAYIGKGWISSLDFFGPGIELKGNEQIQKKKISWMPFEEAREFVHKLKLTKSTDWSPYCQGKFPQLPKKPQNIPGNVNITYKDKGWIGFPDFLGYNPDKNLRGVNVHRESDKLGKKEKSDPEMDKLDKKFPKNAVSSPETTPHHNQLDLDEKKPPIMDIPEGEDYISDDSAGSLF